MKKCITVFLLAFAASGVRAALPQPDLIAQIHFAGAAKLAATPGSAAFTNEFCSAEALALRTQTADKLSGWLAGWLQQNVGASVPGGAAKLRPLLDDLQQCEWFFEARGAVNGQAEAALAIKLDAARAPLWQANLKPFFRAPAFKQSDGWLIFESGTGTHKLADGLAKRISSSDPAWLSLDVNWPRLAQWYPKFKELGLPETQLAVNAAEANLNITGKCFFPENLAIQLEPWRVPTNTLHQPFVSFTAVRGFSAWLKKQSWAQPYQLTPSPNQLFVWALPQIPYQTFAAIPCADATGTLAQAYQRLLPVINQPNASEAFLTPFKLQRTNNEVTLVGVPFAAPYLRAVREPAGQFLLAGAFPNTPRSKPLPPELFQRLAAKDLVLYHWEITAERLPQALNLSQLGLVVTARRQLPGESASMKWIQKIAPTLGNTITEVFQTGPAEMTFKRKAPGGFTAVELLALGNWLEDPNFPGWDMKLPPRPKNLKRPKPAPVVSPAPAPAK